MVNESRVRRLNRAAGRPGPVLYWMSRDQRVQDNWALLYAWQAARASKAPLAVICCPGADLEGASVRQGDFRLAGLKETARQLESKRIPLFVLDGSPAAAGLAFVRSSGAGALVLDFSPLRPGRAWREETARRLDRPVYEVDAHNIVPAWRASSRQEYAAYTIRPKLARLMDEFLEEFPAVSVRQVIAWPSEVPVIDWDLLRRRLRLDAAVSGSGRFRPGGRAGELVMREFLRDKLARYPVDRNDPNADVQSNLSPYLHSGQISAQRVALETLEAGRASKASEIFLEELVTRRELAENYCFYNAAYDRPEGFPEWARRSLEKHRSDRRRYLYRRPELEAGETHDRIWNTAQRQLAGLGKLHGYLRMYWAKKILEWSPDPARAQAEAVYLNDRYALDGRDPNGYAGIAWSIGGVHDRPWFERPVYGQIGT